MFGRVRMYEAGFVVFIVGSALCALAWGEASIVAFRLLQGVEGGARHRQQRRHHRRPVPRERRGRAHGYNGVGFSLGAVLGILLGAREGHRLDVVGMVTLGLGLFGVLWGR